MIAERNGVHDRELKKLQDFKDFIMEDKAARLEVLLKEYELCQKAGHHFENNIWQSIAVFTTLSIAGISFLAQLNAQSSRVLILKIGVACIFIIILALWKGMMARWNSMQFTEYYRMTEIEEELNMWRERYLKYMSRASIGSNQALEDEEPQYINLRRKLGRGYVGPRVRESINLVAWLLLISWVIFLIGELLVASGI